MSKTIFICIGSTKCGTTWLHSQLQRHSNVHMPPGKEIHYWEWVRSPHLADTTISNRFAQLELPGVESIVRVASALSQPVRNKALRLSKLRSMLKSRYSNDHSEYVSYLFDNSGEAKVVCDFTPNYVLLNRRTFSEILNIYPNVKFLLLMRDPVERLWSSVKFENRKAVARGECTKSFLYQRFCDAALDRFDFLHRKSRYEQTIQELEAAVPQELIHFMFYEDIFLRERYESIFDFLDIKRMNFDVNMTINSDRSKISRPPEDQWQIAIENFTETYEFIRSRFGLENVPNEWNL